MAVELNERFENRKNKKVAFVVRHDEKAKTVILQYEEDGKPVGPMTYSTLSKSWKKLAAEPEKVVEEVKEESTEEVAGDGTPYAEVMGEIVAGAEEKAKEKKKEKKEKAPKQKKEKVEKPKKEKAPKVSVEEKMEKVNEIAVIIQESGNIAKIFEKKCMTSIIKNKRSMAEIYARNSKFTIWCKDVVADNFKEKYSVTHHPSCGMKYQFDVTTMDEVADVINFIKEV